MTDLATRIDLGKIDAEDYFLRWNTALFCPNPAAPESAHLLIGHSGEAGSILCHQHKTCEGLVKVKEKYPPRICPHCHADSKRELTNEERALFSKIMLGKVAPTYDEHGQIQWVEKEAQVA